MGAANSGRTSLSFPVQGFVHHGNIATVTRKRAFNKAMVTLFTEVLFIDEAYESALDIANWKILTQWGYTAHDTGVPNSRLEKASRLGKLERDLSSYAVFDYTRTVENFSAL